MRSNTMTEKKSRIRKQPLACIPDLDVTDNRAAEETTTVPTPDKKNRKSTTVPTPDKKNRKSLLKNGKENLKKKVTNNKKFQNIDTDSDSDFDDLVTALKKSCVKIQSSISVSKLSPSPLAVKESVVSKDKAKSSSRKRLYSSDSSDSLNYNPTPAKKSRRESTIANTEKISPISEEVTPVKRNRRQLSIASIEKSRSILKDDWDSTPPRKSRRESSLASAEKINAIFKKENSVTPVKRRRRESSIDNSEKSEEDLSFSAKSIKRKSIKAVSEKFDDSSNSRKSELSPIKENGSLVITLRRFDKDKATDVENSVKKYKVTKTSESLPEYRTPVKRNSFVTPIKKTTPKGRGIKCETPRTPLDEARTSLHVSAVPKSLPCREQEYQNISTFVENKVMDGVGGCMYISGVPGTGKTATVTQVIRKLQESSSIGQLPPFKFIEINGMKLADPRQAYVILYQHIFEKKDRISSDAAQRKLDGYFNKADKKKRTTVLLVDELDLMCNRKQDVVYNLLDWPSKPYSRLVVLTIANTMDMPERKLKGRVNSRLGLTRLTFLPYTHKQLEEIVLARLQGTDAFVVDAVRLATRKVAAVSGDARRALDICRRAAELPEDDQPVRIVHIEQAIKEMTNSNIVRLIRSCSELEKLFLKAVSEVCIRTGLEEVDLLQVIDHLLPLCVLTGLERPPIPGLLVLCHRLKCFRLLFTNNHKGGLLQRITLNLTQDDLHYALRAET